MNPIAVSYFPAPTQLVFTENARRIRNKPYARFFTGEMYLQPEMLPAFRQPISTRDALRSDELSRLLDPTDRAVDTGYCVLPDGTAYVASRVAFPGATADMLAWWFWWFMVERERYSLWHPYSHVRADPIDATSLSAPGLTHEQRYVGITLCGDEYIGVRKRSVRTRFVAPSAWGMDQHSLADAGIAASVHGEIHLGPMRVGRMLRFARNTADGFDLRTWFWIGDVISVGAGSCRPNIAPALQRIGLKSRLINASMAYEQLFKDHVAMNHLASFLPEVYRLYGSGT